MNKLWSYWAKALGQKATDNDSEADKVAWIRTLILVAYLVTNCFIVAGVVRHWDDNTRNLNNCHLLGKQL
jgi:hypothetical protein